MKRVIRYLFNFQPRFRVRKSLSSMAVAWGSALALHQLGQIAGERGGGRANRKCQNDIISGGRRDRGGEQEGAGVTLSFVKFHPEETCTEGRGR